MIVKATVALFWLVAGTLIAFPTVGNAVIWLRRGEDRGCIPALFACLACGVAAAVIAWRLC